MHAHPLHQGRAVEVASLAGLHDHCQRDPGVTPTLPVGASVYVWAPWGRYDPSKLVSLGTNRWTFKTALGISNELGAWTLELVPTGTFFTDNTDFLDGHTHAQEPIYAI